jgi:hypothetical protein
LGLARLKRRRKERLDCTPAFQVLSQQMKPIRFDRHARRRMLQRAITPLEVEAVLRQPERVEPSAKDRQNAFGPRRQETIRVTFRETADEILVITVVRQRTGGGV